jgi:hypothetical protein
MVIDIEEMLGSDTGVGTGSIHAVPAQHVSQHFATYYPYNANMQLDLHGLSKAAVLWELLDRQENLRTTVAFVRQLADYRFGSEENPDLRSHADLSE